MDFTLLSSRPSLCPLRAPRLISAPLPCRQTFRLVQGDGYDLTPPLRALLGHDGPAARAGRAGADGDPLRAPDPAAAALPRERLRLPGAPRRLQRDLRPRPPGLRAA